MPRNPSARPVTTRQFKSPEPPGTIASKNAIHNATVTTKMLATPDGVYCSAHTTNAFPPARRNSPTMTSVRQSTALRGARSPNASAPAKRITPAMKNRSPANKNGGSSPTPTRMARYVDPQKTHTSR